MLGLVVAAALTTGTADRAAARARIAAATSGPLGLSELLSIVSRAMHAPPPDDFQENSASQVTKRFRVETPACRAGMGVWASEKCNISWSYDKASNVLSIYLKR